MSVGALPVNDVDRSSYFQGSTAIITGSADRSLDSTSSTVKTPTLTSFSSTGRALQRQALLTDTNNVDPQFANGVKFVRTWLERNLTRGPKFYGNEIMLRACARQVKNYAHYLDVAGYSGDVRTLRRLGYHLRLLANRDIKKYSPAEVAETIANGLLAAWRLDKICRDPDRRIAKNLLFDMKMETNSVAMRRGSEKDSLLT